jgi:membrane protease YdiL (CAAX protease family)
MYLSSVEPTRMTRPSGKQNGSPAHDVGILNFAAGSYLESTGHPLYALLFLIPLVVIYELGTLLVNTDQIAHTQSRVATFTWLMGLAEWLGMHRSLAWAFPGVVVTIILLCWHLASEYPWRIRFSWLGWMALESLVLSLPLFAIGALLNSSDSFAVSQTGTGAPAASSSWQVYLADLTTGMGAGIYEELVFRLILVGLLIVIMHDLFRVKETLAIVAAVFISAALFAAHHYIGIDVVTGRAMQMEPFEVKSFIFRTVAGIYFAILFYYRGYGITAGAHAAYNGIYFTLRALF